MCKIAILIPCYNEEKTIRKVIVDLKHELKYDADIYVYDNNSTDRTAEFASSVGAIVRNSPVQGKGATVRKMISEIDADIYCMIDGDNTYNVSHINTLIALIKTSDYDMVVADRMSFNYSSVNLRRFHTFGNKLICKILNSNYHANLTDVLTGYRAFSKEFAKELTIRFNGFELEVEMTIFALKNNFKIGSIISQYQNRPAGSFSKLKTLSDGLKILNAIRVLI